MKWTAVVVLSLVVAGVWAVPYQQRPPKRIRDPSHVVMRGPIGEDPDPAIRARRMFVRQMMKDAWDDYSRFAWGENELKPVSQTGQSGGIFGDSKIGATIIDSLDSLFIMEFDEEFQKARDWVANELSFDNLNTTASVFETNIRIVGGFLTVHAMTGDPVFLERAQDMADRLLPAFDSPSGIPYGYLNILTGEPRRGGSSVLAEFGTLHLEFVYLSQVTGNPIYAEKVMKIRQVLKDAVKPDGLYWNYMDPETGEFTNDHVSIGALGDSYYEYLLKAAIQLGDLEARRMYDAAMDGFFNNGLIKVSPGSHMYIAEMNQGVVNDVVGHLACFAGGMFALGSRTDPFNDFTRRARDWEIGQNFTNTCHESYIRTATKIGPEIFRFTDNLEAEGGPGDRGYILRPEVIESYFVLYRLTGDNKYRDWAWEAAQAIEKYCKAGPGRGYSGLRDVDSTTSAQDDVQQTFFLAETLKYLYLMFSAPGLISLDQWVFNTECHPLPIRGRNGLF